MRRGVNLFWIGLAVLWTAALALGMVGFARHAQLHQVDASVWDNLYATLQLIPMNSGAVLPPVPVELQFARFLMPLMTWTAAVQGLMSLFRQQLQMARLRSLHGHIVICGLSRKGMLLASRFREQGDHVVVVERDERNDWIEACRSLGAIVVMGDATAGAMLKRVGVDNARGLFAVCDDDGINAEIAIRARELVSARSSGSLTCLAHVTDPQLCALLREHSGGLEEKPFQLELFNLFERGAREMLAANPPWRDGSGPQGFSPHIVVVGLGRMGENLVVQAARGWWNEKRPGLGSGLRITIVDRNARSQLESLIVRCPPLLHSCELISVECDVHSSTFERADFLFDPTGNPCVDAVYICVDSDSLGLHAGLTLLRRLPAVTKVPIVIRMVEENGLATLLAGGAKRTLRHNGLHAFGLLDRTCTTSLLHSTPRDILARATHEEYRREQLSRGDSEAENPALLPWERLAPEFRAANYRWADHICEHVAEMGFRIEPLTDWEAPSLILSADVVEAVARREHEQWCGELNRDGWSYARGKKDLQEKTHPDMVDWADLPEAEKEKNRLLARGIPSFLGRCGFQLAKE